MHTVIRGALGLVLLTLTATTVSAEVVALYDFQDAKGNVVRDRSGFGKALNLRIVNPKNVKRSAGQLEFRRGTVARSDQPARKIIDAVKKSGQLTVEAWLRPANTGQKGPARIVSISRDPSSRNMTLGQDGGRFDFRLRSTRTSGNGIPSLASRGGVTTTLTHLVYTREGSGRTVIYVNGRPSNRGSAGGDLRNWDNSYRLALGNEVSNDRPWLGGLRRVAIHDRALQEAEVQRLFKAGADGDAAAVLAKAKRHPGEVLFETRIAPLLAEHCLECHDTANRKGKLDLSRRHAAFADESIVPGRSGESAVWDAVLADDMPKQRTPLSAEEKALLKSWIDGGAQWSLEVVDPALYGHGSSGGQQFVQRLTVPEYVATVKAATGVDIAKEAAELLPDDLRADGFSNTAYNLNVDLKHVAAYAQLAGIIVERMDVAAFCRRFGRSRKLVDKDNRALITSMGRWLLRGPLEERELATYRGIATTVASASGGFDAAMGLVIEAMLQSPRFLYRMERQSAGGAVGPYELATRLSYIVWGAPPDAELYRAAEQGRLYADAEIAAQVDRMLQDERAVGRSRQFVSEWLNLGRLRNLNPNPRRFPAWSKELAADMREETIRYFEEIAWRRPMAQLLNARVTFLSPRLAKHYGLASAGEGIRRLELPTSSARGGLLAQGSVLTIGGDEASMVARGLFVLKDLLRGAVKDPPPGVNVTPVASRAGLTQRGVAEERIADANCGGCHAKFEPLAFGLEKFDGIGAYHERDEHGNRLRDDGEILFPGTGTPVTYQNARQLFDLLAGSERVAECLTWKVAQFAFGRPLTAGDVPALNAINTRAAKAGGSYPDVIRAIALSDLVRFHPGS